ncbi:MAG TPA: sugar ABC transporter ATP-binding protein [Tepidisphaeraceae bacterium]|jgi:ABC-type sugar transport system ATPase subunit|nr:sugar ABC transporter ATP-binding protein [Tepidisphaeraceae bacterium]
MVNADPDQPLVRMRGISKRFGPVMVLEGVDFDVRSGEVHILAGENGAGKSTLIKILGGVHEASEGVIEMGGLAVKPGSPLGANRLGISVIYQELSLVPGMTVADNIFLGRPMTGAGGLVRDREQRERARRLLEKLGIAIDVEEVVERLPIAQQQMVEIAKALAREARVIVMDEPTSSLAAPDVRKLFELIAGLKKSGCGIVYISHKMEEIEQIADRITVLRDGKLVGSAVAAEMPVEKLIRLMVGRELGEQFPRHVPEGTAEARLRVEGFSTGRAVKNVSFAVKRGEILGIGGLQGSGASELLLGLFGAYGGKRVSGKVRVDGEEFAVRGPRQSREAGVALLTNDRKGTGLVLPMSVTGNATLAALERLSPGGWRRPRAERETTREYATALRVKAADYDVEVGSLSGGNQQKVAIAKWLATGPRVLLLDEPTRGIDIGAKRDIYQLMNEWTRSGIAIVLITSEMPELLAMSDRIMVMHRGEVTGEFSRGEATADKILKAAMGDNR